MSEKVPKHEKPISTKGIEVEEFDDDRDEAVVLETPVEGEETDDLEKNEELENMLEERLSVIQVPEDIPDSVENLYRIESLLAVLDSPEWNNKDRFLARAAEERRDQALKSEKLSQKQYTDFVNIYRPRIRAKT